MRVIIPMAGLGSRFTNAGYLTHKPLIKVNNKSLIRYAVESLDITGDYIFVCRDLGGTYMSDLKIELDQYFDNSESTYTIEIIDHVTTGAAETALAGMLDSYNGELIITNCDQYLDWDSETFIANSRSYDGCVLTYESEDLKNSFAKTINNKVVKMIEKPKGPIEGDALVGVHYWKKAQDFVSSGNKSLRNFNKKNETYISETYNYLINDGLNIGVSPISETYDSLGKYWSTGTPEDLALFKGMISEYYTKKPSTYFIDLDGTIFKHAHRYSNLKNSAEILPGIKEALDELDSRGDKIILVSARKEGARLFTEQLLDDNLIPYDQLILGVSQGCRVVVNDVLSKTCLPRAKAVNVIVDKGWRVEDLQ